MNLSRKNIYQIGIASQLFQAALRQDEMQTIPERRLNINVTARMFIKKNAKEVSEMFEMIKEEELAIAEKNFGHQINALGYIQFFDGETTLKKFLENEEAFNKELDKLRGMSSKVMNHESKPEADIIRNDFENLKAKYIKTGDVEKAQFNMENFNKQFKAFLEDPEGMMDFRVQRIKAKWFENTSQLPSAFEDYYDEAGLIDYGD